MAEMSPFCGDMEKLEANLNMLFSKLLVRTRSDPVRHCHSYISFMVFLFIFILFCGCFHI